MCLRSYVLIKILKKLFGLEPSVDQTDKESNLKVKTKYDWSKIPREYDWAHTGTWGYCFASEWKPLRGCLGGTGFWYCGGKHGLIHFPRENPYKGDWRDSLEQRPN